MTNKINEMATIYKEGHTNIPHVRGKDADGEKLLPV